MRDRIIGPNLKKEFRRTQLFGSADQSMHEFATEAGAALFSRHGNRLNVALLTGWQLAQPGIADDSIIDLGHQIIRVVFDQFGAHVVFRPGIAAEAGVFESHDVGQIRFPRLANQPCQMSRH